MLRIPPREPLPPKIRCCRSSGPQIFAPQVSFLDFPSASEFLSIHYPDTPVQNTGTVSDSATCFKLLLEPTAASVFWHLVSFASSVSGILASDSVRLVVDIARGREGGGRDEVRQFHETQAGTDHPHLAAGSDFQVQHRERCRALRHHARLARLLRGPHVYRPFGGQVDDLQDLGTDG